MKRVVALFLILIPVSHLFCMDKPLSQENKIIPDRVDQYKFSPDGQRLLTLKYESRIPQIKNNLINLYATATGALLKSFPNRVSSRFKWSPKGTYFAFKGLNSRELSIMDANGHHVHTINTSRTPRKFFFSEDEEYIYYDFINNNGEPMQTNLETGTTKEISVESAIRKSFRRTARLEEPSYTCGKIIQDHTGKWYTLKQIYHFDAQYDLVYLKDEIANTLQLLRTPVNTDIQEEMKRAPRLPRLTPPLSKTFHYIHHTHQPGVIVLATVQDLVYAVNLVSMQIVPLDFHLNKSEIAKLYDTYKQKPRPFISRNGLYLQDSGKHTKICTLNWELRP